MLRGVGVPGAFERVESLIMSLWLFSDLTLLGLLFFACRAMVRELFGGQEYRSVPFALFAIAAGLALWTMTDLFRLSWIMERTMAVANVIFGVMIPLLAAVFAKLRKKNR